MISYKDSEATRQIVSFSQSCFSPGFGVELDSPFEIYMIPNMKSLIVVVLVFAITRGSTIYNYNINR